MTIGRQTDRRTDIERAIGREGHINKVKVVKVRTDVRDGGWVRKAQRGR